MRRGFRIAAAAIMHAFVSKVLVRTTLIAMFLEAIEVQSKWWHQLIDGGVSYISVDPELLHAESLCPYN